MKGKTLMQVEVLSQDLAKQFAQIAIHDLVSVRLDVVDRGEQFPQERRYRFRVMVPVQDQAWAKMRLGQLRGEIE